MRREARVAKIPIQYQEFDDEQKTVIFRDMELESPTDGGRTMSNYHLYRGFRIRHSTGTEGGQESCGSSTRSAE